MNDTSIDEHNPVHIWWTTENIWRAHFPHHSPLPTNTVTKHISRDDAMLDTEHCTPYRRSNNMQGKT
jgi:hypothetical protein